MSSLSALTDPSLTIIFATSPTGLGHLRVTDALYHGLPKNTSPVLLGAKDEVVSAMYRYVSVHPYSRKVMEVLQLPPLDKPFAIVGRGLLRAQTKDIYKQLQSIISERIIVPQTILLVAPHTILGHQLGAIKERLAKELDANVLLVVQVTDDSPQAIWYVYDADLLLVPSEYTKEKLQAYAASAKLPVVPMVVTAYPVSPKLTEDASAKVFQDRVEQTDPHGKETIQMIVPISGAAVGTNFMTTYVQTLHQHNDRFQFHLVTREAPYTEAFIATMASFPYVQMHTSVHDRTTVDNYEKVYEEKTISLEITKPSEQTFKALMTPKQKGGAIMLFSRPVGGQEYDNLYFMRRHGLMPNKLETKLLWRLADKQDVMIPSDLLAKAHHWRAILLPDEPNTAAAFTNWCLHRRLFTRMMHYIRAEKGKELQPNGVEQFWGEVARLVADRKEEIALQNK
jgi:hypothetical protein